MDHLGSNSIFHFACCVLVPLLTWNLSFLLGYAEIRNVFPSYCDFALSLCPAGVTPMSFSEKLAGSQTRMHFTVFYIPGGKHTTNFICFCFRAIQAYLQTYRKRSFHAPEVSCSSASLGLPIIQWVFFPNSITITFSAVPRESQIFFAKTSVIFAVLLPRIQIFSFYEDGLPHTQKTKFFL